MIYARIADKTVADEYFAVTAKVEALYDQPRRLGSDDEGHEMRCVVRIGWVPRAVRRGCWSCWSRPSLGWYRAPTAARWHGRRIAFRCGYATCRSVANR